VARDASRSAAFNRGPGIRNRLRQRLKIPADHAAESSRGNANASTWREFRAQHGRAWDFRRQAGSIDSVVPSSRQTASLQEATSANPALKFTGNGFTRTPTQQFDCGVGVPADEIGAGGLRPATGPQPGLLELDVRCLDHLAPPLTLFLHVPSGLRCRTAKGLSRQFPETVLHFRLAQRFIDIGIDLFGDAFWRARRRDDRI